MRLFTIMSLMFRTNVLHLNFWMCILYLTSILVKLLYLVSRTVIPLEEENVGNKYTKFWKHHTSTYICWVTFMPRVCGSGHLSKWWPFNRYFNCQVLWSHHSFVAMISPTEKLSLYNYNNFSFHNLNQYQVNLPPLHLVQVSVNK